MIWPRHRNVTKSEYLCVFVQAPGVLGLFAVAALAACIVSTQGVTRSRAQLATGSEGHLAGGGSLDSKE